MLKKLSTKENSSAGALTWLASLTTESVVGDLPLHQFQLSYKEPGQSVIHQLKQTPALPGVIITVGSRPIGLISRSKLLEYISWQPYPKELLSRPVEALLEVLYQTEPSAGNFLELPDSCPIQTGAIAAAHRPVVLVSDPVVITFRDRSLRLLNWHDLVLAQSRMMALFSEMNRQRKQQLSATHKTLQHETTKLEQARKDLLAQQQLMHHQQILHKQQQSRFVQEMTHIEQIKQQHQQIEKFFSGEGIQAIQAAVETAQALLKRTQKMGIMGQVLNKKLATFQEVAELTRQISKQVQFLGLRSAILANRAGIEQEGIGQITSDIRQLSGQTLEASQSVEEVVIWLNSFLMDLENTLREESQYAHASIKQTLHLKEELQSLSLLSDAVAREPDPLREPTQSSELPKFSDPPKFNESPQPSEPVPSSELPKSSELPRPVNWQQYIRGSGS